MHNSGSGTPDLNASWVNSQHKTFLQSQVTAGQPSRAIINSGWAQEFGTPSAAGPSIQTNVAQRPECRMPNHSIVLFSLTLNMGS